MLARLKHDYIDGKIRRFEDDRIHAFLVFSTKLHVLRPSNSERVTASALRQYAEAISDIPEFLSQ